MIYEMTKPAVGSGGPPMGHSVGGRALLSAPHDTTFTQGVKLAELRQRADDAKRSGDYAAYCTARRDFLLAQAEEWFFQRGEL